MFINTAGVVLREVPYGDNTKILTVLTGTEGKLTVSAHGTHSKKSKLAAATGLLVFSHMTLTRRGERWTLTEAQTVEQFLGLRDDLVLLALGSYIAELTEALSDEDSWSAELLPLCLNTLYALSEKLKPHQLIKPAFELRLMQIAGYAPELSALDLDAIPQSVYAAGTHAGDRRSLEIHAAQGIMRLSPGAYNAAKYILNCNSKKLFSFSLDEKPLSELAEATEKYLLTHLDRGFKTLDYYKKCAIT